MIKNQYFLFSLLVSLSSSIVPNPTEHEKLLAAIKSSHSNDVLRGLEAREQTKPQTRDISSLLSAAEKGLPPAQTVVTDASAAAQVVSAMAAASGNPSIALAAGGVAQAANIIEPILTSFQSGNTQNEDTALLQAATEAEQIAFSNSGIKSRLLAACVATGCFVFMGVKIWADCFSTNNATADEKAAALSTDAGVLTTAGSLGIGGLYYAITNKYNTDAQTQAKMITRAVSGHVAKSKG